MKKGLLYLLLLMYTLGVIKATLPFVYDAAGHFFIYQHHITTVHKINGKQHVQHEFIQKAKKENSESKRLGFKKIIPTDEHLYLPFYHVSIASVFVEQSFCSDMINLSCRPINGNFRPPKQAFV